MNQKDRKRADEIAAILEKASSEIGDELAGELESMADDEQGKFDNLSEGLQAAESGQRIEAAANALRTASEQTQAAIDALAEAVSELQGIE